MKIFMQKTVLLTALKHSISVSFYCIYTQKLTKTLLLSNDGNKNSFSWPDLPAARPSFLKMSNSLETIKW